MAPTINSMALCYGLGGSNSEDLVAPPPRNIQTVPAFASQDHNFHPGGYVCNCYSDHDVLSVETILNLLGIDL
ncbi:hypothetical protein Dtox_0391 [Desulfofarcimen acetoxidans DSM 771]|uniref:Uncharacterized protein n=1 Tax=Desulfofarcimen acetoxidans (strain ATCC 49208 / DSM 771 / KCTC 5769 / VKM B-1644 / 5575) TaxID=485916 RepID=C8W4Y4_DESAS|nr:hypothetical protein Dtox_0391 [Desulfofarcimen acetoxidans DSM 771]